jgi:hypothetical protein
LLTVLSGVNGGVAAWPFLEGVPFVKGVVVVVMLAEQPKGDGRTIVFLPIDQAAGPAWLSPCTLPHGPGELIWSRLAS